jgi:hypothetical protein
MPVDSILKEYDNYRLRGLAWEYLLPAMEGLAHVLWKLLENGKVQGWITCIITCQG